MVSFAKDRYTLPEVLEQLQPYGCKQSDLFDYLRQDQLHAVCFPYRLEPNREIPIDPNEWTETWRDSYEFPIYDGHIGQTNIADHDTPVPLHIV